MLNKSPFAIHKALIRIGGEPKSVKRLRSRDLLIEATSALQTKSFILAKSFLNNPISISSHKTLNSCRGVISEPHLLTTPEREILEGFSNQGVIQPKFTDNYKSRLTSTVKSVHTFQILCAALSARGLVTPKPPAMVN
ncbi:putative RNA-directed DNA polymerase from transposon BS [Trichonephila clavipes]|nr:putative RNA-directed DNA polymerase from transposon BS [Trichonephila clavipes]